MTIVRKSRIKLTILESGVVLTDLYNISHDKSETCVKFPHPHISIFHTVHLNSPTSIIPSLYVSQNMVNGSPGVHETRSDISDQKSIQIES